MQKQVPYTGNAKISTLVNTLEAKKGLSLEEIEFDYKEKGIFYFILDSNGAIVKDFNLPEGLDHSYTPSEIASFSKWYLEDYPVLTRILDNNDLLIIGYPKNSMVKYNLYLTISQFYSDILFFPIILLINFIIFLFLLMREIKNEQKALLPIISGIEDLADGKSTHLEETGPLKEANVSLNKVSKLLAEREKSRTDWISGVSHDIRTPLTRILASTELLEVESDSLPYLESIENNAITIKKLVDDLNLDNKLRYSDLSFKKEEKDLVNFLKGFIASIESTVDQSKYPIVFTSSLEEAQIQTNTDLLSRMLINIINNSIEHNPDGVSISISLSENPNEFILIIQDNGKGIDQEELKELIKSNPDYSMRGYGLNLINQIARELSGEVIFDSSIENGFITTINLKKGKSIT